MSVPPPVPPPPPPYGPPPHGPPPYGPPPAGPPPYPGPPYPSYPPYPVRPPLSGWAIASLIFGILGGILVSVVTGIVALAKTKDGRFRGRGLAVAGLALSGVWLVITAVIVFFVVRSEGNSTDDGSVRATTLQTGDCLPTLPGGEELVLDVDKVGCEQPHIGEVFASIPILGSEFPGYQAMEDYQDQCATALAGFSPDAMADDEISLYTLYPTEVTWQQGDRTMTCIATTETPTTGSLRG
jgi:Domain of unknown function (DUF4190)/Septum formation